MNLTASAFANTDLPRRWDRRLTELPTGEQLARAILQQGQDAISTRLQEQLRSPERAEIAATPTMRDEELKVLELPIFKPLPQRPQESFGALQEWEGVITNVTDKLVYAILVDITGGGKTLDETAEIPIEEIADDDQARLVRGAIFRWVIGYLRKASGTKMRASVIYFRRAGTDEGYAFTTPSLVFETPHG